jgi:hypothetical protein
MSGKYQQAGFHQIRHDRLWQEQVHDSYKAKGKLPEPSMCPQCGAVFHQGRWQWMKAPDGAHSTICPACHRISDHFPAGFLTIHGDFIRDHRDEVMNLVHHIEKREKAEHPMKRIMAINEQGGEIVVTTTDINLARSIGDALHHAYKGDLEFHYNEEQNLLRVDWVH